MADFDDDEYFGFRCTPLNRPPLDSNRLDTSKKEYKSTNDEYDRKPATTKISKGKGVTFESVQWQTPEHPITLALSPISPFTPPDNQQYQQKQQQPSRSFINVNTLSPELTGPQTAISTSPQIAPDKNITGSTSVISDDPFTANVPPSTRPTYEDYTLVKSELPQMDPIRQLALTLLQQNVAQHYSVLNLADNGDEAVQAELTRKNNVQWVCQQIIEKLSNRERTPIGNQDVDDSVFTYAPPNPKNERNVEKIRQYKQLYSALEKEAEERKQAIFYIYTYHARFHDLQRSTYDGKTINLGSCTDYIDSMDKDQQDFIGSYQQWKDENNSDGDDDDGASIASLSTDSTSLQKLVLQKGRAVTELRQQLNFANERQKQAGKLGDRLLADISTRLKQKTLGFPSISNPMEDVDDPILRTSQQPSISSPLPPLTSSISSPQSANIHVTDIERLAEAQRMKKRRLLGLVNDVEMYGKANFELFQTMSKLK
ncbi:hypothetical protein BCR42DRAFT_413111 [Absidia repens]|uniref:Uncharacterized protein n=1 Tax=Absidia repens TaxID=90262 RepID=A0A1X2IKN8_9FUNG|nr:hypothetical protein BCR42DRAFT_413111 [Absidia repens]